MENTINERINEIRMKFNLSVNSFAKKIETSQSTLKSIIDSKTKPGYDTIHKIIIEFSISPDWLILGNGSMDYSENINRKDFSIDILIDRIEKLSAENAILKQEIDYLKSHESKGLVASPFVQYRRET